MNKLEETFQRIMRDYGHDVLVMHNHLDEVCSCYDYATGSATRHCPYCFGTGHVSQIKKYRTRYVDANVPESNVFLTNTQTFGSMSVGAKSYFFYKDKKLKVGDLIMEVDWEGDRPVQGAGGIYEISLINKLRYLDGKTVFYKVFVKEQPINKSIRGFQIIEENNELRYQLAEDKPYNLIDPHEKIKPYDKVVPPRRKGKTKEHDKALKGGRGT